MAPALIQDQSYLSRLSWRNRLVSFLLALATTVLIALLMLAMGALGPGEHPRSASLNAVQFATPSSTRAPHAHTAAKHSPAPPQIHPPVPHPPVVKPPVVVSPLLTMSHQEYAASDIANLPRHADEGSSDNGHGNSASTYGPGEGPGGAHLYNAEWYREPTHAELAPYLAKTNAPGEWAMIACRTIEHYHVENCQELDESPPGSGLARALRQASWQFLVRPVRVDGHVLIGSWVRIKFTFTRSERSVSPADLPGVDNGQ